MIAMGTKAVSASLPQLPPFSMRELDEVIPAPRILPAYNEEEWAELAVMPASEPGETEAAEGLAFPKLQAQIIDVQRRMALGGLEGLDAAEELQECAARSERLGEAVAIARAQKKAEGGYTATLTDDGSAFMLPGERQRKRILEAATARGEKLAKDLLPSPNVMLRGGLFWHGKLPAVRTEQNRFRKVGELRVNKKVVLTLLHWGVRLDQQDLDVWLAALARSRDQIGKLRTVRLAEIIRAAGKSNEKATRSATIASLMRLQRTKISWMHADRIGSLKSNLLDDVELQLAPSKTKALEAIITYRIDAEIADLFGGSQWSALDLEMRRKLNNAPTAKWLHARFVTYGGEPTATKIETLMLDQDVISVMQERGKPTCAPGTPAWRKAMHDFREDVRQALRVLIERGAWSAESRICAEDKLHVVLPGKPRTKPAATSITKRADGSVDDIAVAERTM